ncbi:MAG: hypothetical protein KDD06_26850 [Phaeodactylibacter sp.]|nr:hypothetical protein [Phaeodactylibacter sp.]MCB9288290.1 hypothetical protein [Lewinellaceae bacterium]
MNNFQRLEEEQARLYDASRRRDVQENLSQTFGLFKFIGQIVDVYLPAMIGVLVSAAGGKGPDGRNQGLNRPPSEGGEHPGKVGPHPPNGDAPRR